MSYESLRTVMLVGLIVVGASVFTRSTVLFVVGAALSLGASLVDSIRRARARWRADHPERKPED